MAGSTFKGFHCISGSFIVSNDVVFLHEMKQEAQLNFSFPPCTRTISKIFPWTIPHTTVKRLIWQKHRNHNCSKITGKEFPMETIDQHIILMRHPHSFFIFQRLDLFLLKIMEDCKMIVIEEDNFDVIKRRMFL